MKKPYLNQEERFLTRTDTLAGEGLKQRLATLKLLRAIDESWIGKLYWKYNNFEVVRFIGSIKWSLFFLIFVILFYLTVQDALN